MRKIKKSGLHYYMKKREGEKVDDSFKEFVYEILKHSELKLLDIPYARDSIPQINIKQYLRIFDSKHHEKESFLWYYKFVNENLKHC